MNGSQKPSDPASTAAGGPTNAAGPMAQDFVDLEAGKVVYVEGSSSKPYELIHNTKAESGAVAAVASEAAPTPRPQTPPTPLGSLPIDSRDWSMDFEERQARITKRENEHAEQEKRDVASVRRGYKDEADEIEWRRNIEAIAQEWMLDSAAKATLREMGEMARAMNKRQLICSPAPAVIDSGASDTMTNNLALIANPVPTRVSVQQADGSRIILPHSALNGKNPFSILYPDRTPPFELFKPFGCAATILKDAKD